MVVSDLATLPATTLARMVRERAVSAVEIVTACLDRIAAVDGALRSIVALDAEGALASARRADAAAAVKPLHGVPFTVKDNLAAAGLPMAIGVPERAHVVAERDATAVARLRAAGAILL